MSHTQCHRHKVGILFFHISDEVGLEILEWSKLQATGIHLDKEFLTQPKTVQFQYIEFQFLKVTVCWLNLDLRIFLADGIQHAEHGANGGVFVVALAVPRRLPDGFAWFFFCIQLGGKEFVEETCRRCPGLIFEFLKIYRHGSRSCRQAFHGCKIPV